MVLGPLFNYQGENVDFTLYFLTRITDQRINFPFQEARKSRRQYKLKLIGFWGWKWTF